MRDAFLGRVENVLECAHRTSRFAIAFEKQKTEIVIGFRVAGEGGFLEELCGGSTVFFDAAAFGEHHGQRECSRHVAEFSGARVPVHSGLFIFADAKAFGVDAANEGVGLRFAARGGDFGKLESG